MFKLREYQKKAIDLAIENEKSIIQLPTGLGKTIIGAFFLKRLFKEKKIRRAIVLVPTRILVEQTYRMYKKLGISTQKIYGVVPKTKRKNLWSKGKIIISTPETVYNDLELIGNIDALVIDECHHSIGNDPYVKVLQKLDVKYKLGLSAYIPNKYKKFLESLIGPVINIIEISPDVYHYIPSWIGDIYETFFDKKEYELYNRIDELRRKSTGSNKLLYTLALKYFSSDGAISLKDTISRDNKISQLLKDYKEEIYSLRDFHKLQALYQVLDLYDGFEKAIIFVDRLVTARFLYKELLEVTDYRITLIRGGLREKMRDVLENAKSSDIIISTPAGEEGVDLPEADLLIIISSSSSPLRFIQRHGRILRPSEKLKFATYLVTPDTIDMDIFLSSLESVRKYIDLPISEHVIKKVWKESRLSKVLNLLTEPLPEEFIKDLSGLTIKEVRLALKKGVELGDIVYFYTPWGKTYILRDFAYIVKDKFSESFKPKYEGIVKIKIKNKTRKFSGNYENLVNKLSKYLPLENITILRKKKYGDIIELEPINYKYQIDSKLLLELVLSNALSDIKKI